MNPLPHKSNLFYIYKQSFVKAYVVGDALLISTEIPTFPQDYHYDVYKIQTYNVPLHSPNGNSENTSTKLIANEENLIISKDKTTFGFMTDNDLQICANSGYICDKPTVIYNQQFENCLHQLFVNQIIIASCKFSIQTAVSNPSAIKIDNSRYLLLNVPSPIRISCPNSNDHFENINSHSIIDIKCRCELHTKFFKLLPHPNKCRSSLEPVIITYPLNIPQLSRFDMPEFNATNLAKTIVHSPPKLSNIDSNLNDKFDFIDSPPPINNIGDGLAINDYNLQGSTTDYIFGSVFFIWNVIISITLGLMCCRFKNGVLMAAATTLPHSNSFVINPTVPPVHEEQIIIAVNRMSTYILALTGLVIIAILMKPIRIMKFIINMTNPVSKGQRADLYLKIFNQSKTSMTKLTSIPLDHKIKYLTIPELVNYNISYDKIWPKIYLKWSNDLVYSFQNREDAIQLPNELTTSLRTALIIQDIKHSQKMQFYALIFMPNEENKFYYFDQLNKAKV